MPTTTAYSFGDIVLVPFPFTDQSTTKQRPAVVVSSAAYHRARHDLILMAVSSQPAPVLGTAEARIQAWKQAGLLKPSVLKPLLVTFEKTLVIRKLGALQEPDLDALRTCLREILGD
jgi:mRNA interferase MazF